MHVRRKHFSAGNSLLVGLVYGIGIKVLLSDLQSIGVDTPEDLARAEARLREESRK